MFYTHAQLDRADHLRNDEAVQTQLYDAENAKLLPVWRGKLLVGDDDTSAPYMLSVATNNCPVSSDTRIFLGLVDQQPIFTQSISNITEKNLGTWLELAQAAFPQYTNIRFDDLRAIGPSLFVKNEGALMAYARGLTYWHDNTRYCSRCGQTLHSISAGHIKRCDNSDCSHQTFPRTDPAVIMLVTRPATNNSPALCLLGRSKNWPPGVFSTLAGFVETGESLEQAVQREVLEEANISTENIRYIASQPWPFPRSIMLGFEATATSTEITCDPDELEDAQWFSVEQLRTFGTWGDKAYKLQLPRQDSIARLLIERWMTEQAS